MSTNVTPELIYEVLKKIQDGQSQLLNRVGGVETRLRSVEQQLLAIHTHLAGDC